MPTESTAGGAGPASDGAAATGSASTEAGARGARWSLVGLYDGPGDPRLAADAAEAQRRAEQFAAAWRGQLADNSLSAVGLRDALLEYEAILELGSRPEFYAGLLAAADSQDPVALDLEQRTGEQQAELRTHLVFFELALAALDDGRFEALVGDAALAGYAHFLRALRRFTPHVLSEPEERALTRKDLSGRHAFVQLYDELAASLRFRVRGYRANEELAEGEVVALLHHADRPLRQRALDAVLEGYAGARLTLTAIMNALLLDHRLECDMRKYRDVVAPTHLANEIDAAIVATMMDAVERHYPVIRRFLKLKAELLGLSRLGVADLYAPIDDHDDAIPYPRARRVVLEAFERFDPAFAASARAFFDRAWIDAELRPGKRHGAFCAALGPSHHPYVLASYADTTRDVATLAHELGHGVHYTLARGQTFLNYNPPLVLAETASVFAEMLVTDHLLTQAPDAATRRRILVETLDEMYGTVFRQNALTRFELATHAACRTRRLSADDLCDLWTREQARLFGDAVDMEPVYRFGWTYVPHFVHSRFYCYAYAFGELLTLALFQRYKQQGQAFLPGYRALLASGASRDPVSVAAGLGFDLRSPSFWDGGCAAIAAMVDELAASR